MKKYFYALWMMAALLVATTSCSNEDELIPSGNNGVEVSFKLAMDGVVPSRTIGNNATDDTYGRGQVVDNVIAAVYSAGTEIATLRKSTNTINDDLTCNVTFRLIEGQTYDFVFWAEKKGTGFYDTKDLKAIKVNYDEDKKYANDESRDAFTAVRKGLVVKKGGMSENIVLTRPFAQLNIASTDEDHAIAEAAGFGCNKLMSKVSIKGVYNVFNAYEEKPITTTTTDIDFDLANVPGNSTIGEVLKNVKEKNDATGKNYEGYLSMNYFLASTESSQNIEVVARFESSTAGSVPVEITVPHVPVQRNYRTNIIGNILTEQTVFNIIIDPNFKDDYNYYTEKELAYAFANGGEVTLDRDVVLTEPMILDDKDKLVSINLNGHTITAPMFAESDGTISAGTTDSYPFFVKAGTLNIKGHGRVKSQACKYSMGVFAIGADAKVNIYDGIYENAGEGSDLIYAKNGAKINIYNGTFIACEKKSGVPGTQEKHSALNLYSNGAGGSEIKVYGGRFFEFNPADNLSESPKVSFVAEGYAVTKEEKAGEGTYYKVVPSSEVFASTGDLTLYSNVTADKTVVLAAGQDLDGGNYSLAMKKSNAQFALQPAGGTIKNLSIEGYNTRNSDAKVIRGIYIVKPTSDVVIDNVSVSGVAYPLNTGTKTSTTGLKLTVSNSTFKGWSSWDGGFASASFTKCTFGVGTYFSKAEEIADHWNGMARPYIDTTFEECEFNDGFVIDAKFIVNEGKTNEKTYQPTIILKKCTYKGQAITAADLASLIDAGDPTDKIDIQN